MDYTIDHYTEGWTSPIQYNLYNVNPETGEKSTFDAAGMTATMVLKDKDGNVVDTVGDVSWSDEANSQIQFIPDATDFDASKSPYSVHWKVTDAWSQIAFYPQGAALLWIVHSV